MDENLIYAKTAAGREAMRQRTRVVQRNMRMVLILVDGNATVAELCAKIGNAQLVESALEELEAGGFIEPILEEDSLREQSKRGPQEIKDVALAPMEQVSSVGEKSQPPTPEPEISPVPAVLPPSVLAPSIPQIFPAAEVVPPVESVSVFAGESHVEVPGQAGPQLNPSKEGVFSRLKARWMDKRASFQGDEDDFHFKPIRRGGRWGGIGWPLGVFLGVLGLTLALLLVAQFFPYSAYLPEVEAALMQSTGVRTQVGEMRLSIYPRPGLLLENVRLGDDDGVRIAEIRLNPVASTLMASRKVFRDVELDGMKLPAAAMGQVRAALAASAGASSRFELQHLSLSRAEITLQGLGLSDMNGEIKLASDGLFQSLILHSADRSLKLEAKAAGKGLDLTIEGFAWRPTAASPYVLDSILATAFLEGNALTITNMDARIFDGLVQGTLALGGGRTPGMAGDLVFQRISARKFGAAQGLGDKLDGEIGGKMHFSAFAAAWDGLFAALVGEGNFAVQRGNLGGIDLTEAVRHTSATPTRGGGTRFERFSGSFRLSPDGIRLSDLNLASGLMSSTGQATITRDGRLAGNMEVQMRGSVNQLRAPVAIGGTLKEPFVQMARR